MTIKKVSVLLGLIGVLGLTLWQLKPKANYKNETLEVNGQIIKVEIADTTEKRALGLGNRDFLASDYGMLFIFPEVSFHSIWMKNMRFPIDIVWLREGRVVDMAEKVPIPDGEKLVLATYQPKEASDQVLELGSGKIEELKIKIGTEVKIR